MLSSMKQVLVWQIYILPAILPLALPLLLSVISNLNFHQCCNKFE